MAAAAGATLSLLLFLGLQLMLVALPGANHQADVVADALADAIITLPAQLAKSLTGRRGRPRRDGVIL